MKYTLLLFFPQGSLYYKEKKLNISKAIRRQVNIARFAFSYS